MSFSTEEQESIEEILNWSLDTWGVDSGKVLHLGLVLLGERDGFLWSFSGRKYAETLQNHLNSIDVPFNYRDASDLHQFFIARSESHLHSSNLTEGRGFGEFFGYPTDAINWYVSHTDPLDDFQEYLETESEYTVNEFWDEHFLIEYIPSGTADGVTEAERRQEQYASALKNSSVNFSQVVNSPQSL